MWAKIRPRSIGKECCGCLIPTEIVHIAKLLGLKDWNVDWAERKLKEGDSTPNWFYFIPTKEIEAKLREHNRRWCRHDPRKNNEEIHPEHQRLIDQESSVVQ